MPPQAQDSPLADPITILHFRQARAHLLEEFVHTFDAQVAEHLRQGIREFTLAPGETKYADLSANEKRNLLYDTCEKYSTEDIRLRITVHENISGEAVVQLDERMGCITYMTWRCCSC